MLSFSLAACNQSQLTTAFDRIAIGVDTGVILLNAIGPSAGVSPAVLAQVSGYLADVADALPKVQALVDGQAKQLEDQARAAIFAADKADAKGRRLTPAMEAFWATQPIKSLEAFMAIASHVVQVTTPAAGSGTSQPAIKLEAAADSSTGTEVLTHNGMAWEAMSALEKHDLHEADRERYEALKRNFAERGSPRAQSQQQRVSA